MSDRLTEAPARRHRPVAIGVAVLVGQAVVAGVLTGVLWARATVLPGYRVNADGGAVTTERGLTEMINGDVTFAAIGLVTGIGLGVAGWRWLGRRLGWGSVVVTAGCAVIAAVLCWQIGQLLGPSDFTDRLRAAAPGDVVSIDLRLRAVSAVVVWVFGAAATLLAITTFVGDDEEPRLLHFPWSTREDHDPTAR